MRASIGLAVLSALAPCVGCCPGRTCPPPPDGVAMSSEAEGALGRMMQDMAGAMGRSKTGPPEILLLSGGGQWGAYGAGFLNGWYAKRAQRNDKPEFEFDVVTGISTGALLSTFAFLGTGADLTVLSDVYRNVDDEDILDYRSTLSLPFANAIADSAPLRRLISDRITDDVLDRVSREGEKGRRLFVGTVDLDSGSFVIWNMTSLAVNQRETYRDVILASASIPAAFPPVLLEESPHVDGGVRHQVFLERLVEQMKTKGDALVQGLRARQATLRAAGELPGTVYAIVNGKVGPEPACPRDCLLDVAVRSVAILTDEGLAGSLIQSNVLAKTLGMDFKWTKVAMDFPNPPSGLHENFDTEFMRRLYDAGLVAGGGGPSWETAEPLPFGLIPIRYRP